MDPLQSFLSHLSPSRAKSPALPTKPSQIKSPPTPQTTKSRFRRHPPPELPLQSHKLSSSVSSSNLLAPHTPNAVGINPSASTSNLRATSPSPEDRPGRSKRLGTLAQEKFKITAETPVDDIINFFEEVAGLDNYTSKLNHDDQPPKPSRSGGAADVYRVATVDRTYVAVKCIFVKNGVSDSKVIKRSARELEVWSTLRHKNILPLLGLAKYQGFLAMVSNWMSSGSIVEYVKDKHNKIRYTLSHQVVEAVAYLHARDIIHGDLKGENVLVSDDGVPMLTDFGLTMMAESRLILSATNAGGGTLRYAAPELFPPRGRLSRETDVYALGMTILQILTGEQPFAEIESTLMVIGAVVGQQTPQRPECLMLPTQLDDAFWEAMTRCWVFEPARRAQVTEIEELVTIALQQEQWSQQRFKITAETLLGDAIDYFERAVGLVDYTSKLDHNQSPVLHRCGGMASVHRVATTGGTYVALKCAYVDACRPARELEVWSVLKHKNIFPLLGFAEYRNQLAAVSNWTDFGDVVDFVNKRPSENRHILSKQVVEAVVYLHSWEIIHGDIKGRSVLMSDDGTPMLSSFDFASMPESCLISPATSESGGTLRWMAPELLKGSGGRSQEADVYALGMTILEILTGKLPFAEDQYSNVKSRVIQGETPQRPECHMPPSRLNDAFWGVMTRCWTYEPAQRPTVMEVANLIEDALDQEESDTTSYESC